MLKIVENSQALTDIAVKDLPRDQVIIEGLVLGGFIGVFDHEYTERQPIRFDITVDIKPFIGDAEYDVSKIVRYDYIVSDIKTLLEDGHIDLVETLAEKVAALCLSYDRAEQVCVGIAKPNAIAEASAVGVKITRRL